MNREIKYNIGDVVFLVTDTEQKERLVTGIIIRPGSVMYYLACGTNETGHYAEEIADTKDILKAINN